MSKIIQFKITVNHSEPTIWRTFQVTDDYRLDHFHQVIQIAMGWDNSHLHKFDFKGVCYEMSMPHLMDDYDEGEDETECFLRDLSLNEGDQIDYLYDFGDGWAHTIEVGKISAGTLQEPICIEGQNACPLEDSGGILRYNYLLVIIKDPNHPEYEDWENWIPDEFTPNVFPRDAINKELKRFGAFRRKNPDAKSTPWHQI